MAIGYNPKIVTNGLILCLDAANRKSYPGSGTTWFDLSGNGNNGTLVSGVTFNTEGNGTMVFDGTSQYVDMGDKFNLATQTISFWMKLNTSISVPSSQNQRPWGKSTDLEARWGGGTTTANASLVFDLGIASPINLTSTQNLWNNSVWYNVSVNWNTTSNISQVYVQGILNATGTANPGITSQAGNFNIGRSGTRGYLAGRISQFTIYNRVLSASEVQQNFQATRGRYGL
jgi:hypothetical protein